MADDNRPDRPDGAKLEQEKAVADAERDPAIAMAEGKTEGSRDSEPSDPVNPNAHETGQNYHGEDTVFTHPPHGE